MATCSECFIEEVPLQPGYSFPITLSCRRKRTRRQIQTDDLHPCLLPRHHVMTRSTTWNQDPACTPMINRSPL
ncbi:MAG: hypothetical protein VCA40_07065 [Roseibacillus sp.]